MANQQSDAKVTALTGKAYAERNGTRITLTEGADIYASDTIITDGTSGVEVVFRDNAVIKLGPGSQVAVQDFVYDGESNPSFAVQLVTGVMTSLSGEVVKQNPAAFKISTPRATIGIRGTETYHSVQGGTETHAVIHISKGHIVMLNSGDGQGITLGSAMQAVTLNESGKPLTIRTFQPSEMDKLQDALGTVNKQVQVQMKKGPEGDDGQNAQQSGEEGAQNAPEAQAAASSVVVQNEIRVVVVAEAGTDTTVALVQDAMTQTQVSTGVLIDSPVISPIGGGGVASAEGPLTDTILADNPLAGSAVEFVPPSNPTPPTAPEAPAEQWQIHTQASLADGQAYTATEGNDSITVGNMGRGSIINAVGGNDIIKVATADNSIVNGGAGDDSLYIGTPGGSANKVTISGVEHVYGSGGVTVSVGDGGENATFTGVDVINGGAGNDTLSVVNSTVNTISGGVGDDILYLQNVTALPGTTTAYGGEGNDSITLDGISRSGIGAVNVNVTGGSGNDVITVNNVASGINLVVEGSDGNDVITINSASGVPFAGSISGGIGDDTISITDISVNGLVKGGDGADVIKITSMTGGTVQGELGNDVINIGTLARGDVYGDNGNDKITVTTMTGGTVYGGAGADNITIGTLAGGTVNGDAGNDIIDIKNIAAGGVASVTGGEGSDTFKLGSWEDGSAIKVDMNGLDTLQFTGGSVIPGAAGPHNSAGYGVDFMQDGKTLTVIFNSQADYEALKANISGVAGPI